MRKASELFLGVGCSWNGIGNLSDPVHAVQVDSRKVEKGDLFVAIPGFKTDGRQFIQDAIRRGAWGIVTECKDLKLSLEHIPQFDVQNSRKAFSALVANFYGRPAHQLQLIGVTGTNGKTTVSLLIHYLLNRFSSCGLIGTVYYDDGRTKREASHTTPSAEVLNQMFLAMVDNRLSYCSMEVSSHALDQDRTDGLGFAGVVFTNLTQDHFDYHKGFEDYYAAKRKLFIRAEPPHFSVVNTDDPYGLRLAKEIRHSSVLTYGFNQACDYRAEAENVGARKIAFDLVRKEETFHVEAPLPFRYNILNVLAALACLDQLGYPLQEAISFLKEFPGVPGRMEPVDEGQDFNVFVDYAHTPDAFQNVLSAARLTVKKSIVTVFGCGGDRDRAKRPMMGEIAARYSDVVILTSDNPRNENPENIIEEIRKGIPEGKTKAQLFIISDREEAIARALKIARKGDCVLILGKGHEDYQIVRDRKIPFRDQDVVRRMLKSANSAAAIGSHAGH